MSTTAGIQFLHESDQSVMVKPTEAEGIPQPPLEIPYEEAIRLVDLPPADKMQYPPADLWKTMLDRRTLRRYQETPLTLNELTLLLWFSQGVKSVTDRPVTMRTVPSGGARHPLETYLIVTRVEGLEPGLYRYQAIPHKLSLIRTGALAEELRQKAVPQNHIRDCAVSFWWAVDSFRTTWRYSTRGYRYILMDSGHACQNLTLAAEGIQCGVCAIGSFDDGAINQFFGMDGKERFIIYGATVGKR